MKNRDNRENKKYYGDPPAVGQIPFGKLYENESTSNKDRGNFKYTLSAEDLDAYETASPGSAAKILAMMENEQNQRHKWENAALRGYILSNRIGMFCGLTFAVYLIYVVAALSRGGYILPAAGLGIGGFLVLALLSKYRFFRSQRASFPHRSADAHKPNIHAGNLQQRPFRHNHNNNYKRHR